MPIPFTIEMEKDRVVRGDFFPARKQPKGTVVVSHGFKGFKDWGFFPYIGEQLSEELDVITYNFSHNGVGETLTEFTELDKFGRNTYSKEQEDLHTLVEQITSGAIPGLPRQLVPQPLFLLGHSKGGGTSLIYAFDHPGRIAGVISWNGIANVDLFSEKDKEIMRTEGRAYTINGRTKQQMPLDKVILEDMEQNQERFDIVDRVKDSKIPIVLIQGSDDAPWLIQGSKRLVEKRPDIMWHLVPEGNHTFGAVHPFRGETGPLKETVRLSLQWIYERI